MKSTNQGSVAGFIIPSVLGILLFMIPIQFEGSWTIVVKILADIINKSIGEYLPILCAVIITVSALLGIASLRRPTFITSYPLIEATFSTTLIWTIIRTVGAVFVWLTFFGVDAEDGTAGLIHMITSQDAGGFVLKELLDSSGKKKIEK